jgi:protein-S-isoprenylcysteine O-methyltransferase Ste14
VWELNSDWGIPLLAVRTTGLISFSITLLQTDLTRFAGLSQALAYIRNQPLPLAPERLKTTGPYKFSRHPLYIFSILILWSTPNMTDTYLAFCASVTLYFIIGSRFEEKRMLNTFGDAYARYQTQVPWLFPLPYKNKND